MVVLSILIPLHAQENFKSLPLVAVNQLEYIGLDSTLMVMATDRLRSELIKSGAFKILERSQMEAILSEQAFQQSGCVGSQCVVQMGQLLGADFIIAGKVGRSQDLVSASLKFISVESGEIIHSVDQTATFSNAGILDAFIPSLAVKLAKVFTEGMQSRAASIGLGDIFVETSPTGASVWLDDELQPGQTPLTISNVRPGTHEVRARLDEQGIVVSVDLEPSGLEKLQLELKELRSALRVKSDPANCPISIDGASQKVLTPYLFKTMSLGSHQIRVDCRGWQSKIDSVNIEFGVQAESNSILKRGAVIDVKSKRIPYQLEIAGVANRVLVRDTFYTVAPGEHYVRMHALDSDGLVFETVERKKMLKESEEWELGYVGNLDPDFVKHRQERRRSLLRWSSAALGFAGLVGVIINQREHDRLYKLYNQSSSQKEFDHLWDETEKSRQRRNASAIVVLLGGFGFGVSYAF